VIEKDAARCAVASADAAPELVQLRKPETFGVLDDHDRRVRHVDTDFDHSGCDEKAGLTGLEGAHGLVLFFRRHPAMNQ
jgi:hypothetical protein